MLYLTAQQYLISHACFLRRHCLQPNNLFSDCYVIKTNSHCHFFRRGSTSVNISNTLLLFSNFLGFYYQLTALAFYWKMYVSKRTLFIFQITSFSEHCCEKKHSQRANFWETSSKYHIFGSLCVRNIFFT